jgi:hypothetical protein
MAFVEVVEELEIYNFHIYALVHFCSEISSLDFSNRAMLISKQVSAPRARRCSRYSRPAASACRRTGCTRTPRPARA